MPFVNVRTVKGLLDASQKRDLQARITDLMVQVEGNGNPAFRPYVWVLIDEQEPNAWCVGGTQVSHRLLEALVSGAAELEPQDSRPGSAA